MGKPITLPPFFPLSCLPPVEGLEVLHCRTWFPSGFPIPPPLHQKSAVAFFQNFLNFELNFFVILFNKLPKWLSVRLCLPLQWIVVRQFEPPNGLNIMNPRRCVQSASVTPHKLRNSVFGVLGIQLLGRPFRSDVPQIQPNLIPHSKIYRIRPDLVGLIFLLLLSDRHC